MVLDLKIDRLSAAELAAIVPPSVEQRGPAPLFHAAPAGPRDPELLRKAEDEYVALVLPVPRAQLHGIAGDGSYLFQCVFAMPPILRGVSSLNDPHGVPLGLPGAVANALVRKVLPCVRVVVKRAALTDAILAQLEPKPANGG